MTKENGPLVEAVARAIGGKYYKNWSLEARAAIKAVLEHYTAAGLVVVPKEPTEPTEKMATAFHQAQWRAKADRTYQRRLEDFADRYKAMLKASEGEAAGTHGSPELDDDARKLAAMGQDPGMTLEELLAPAAPETCEWEPHRLCSACGEMLEKAQAE